jgi:glycosyltransferase involved in cell wall biosynthesis
MPKRVLFHRDYRRAYGGHMKVLDYFKHTQAADGYRAEIYVTPTSLADHPWRHEASLMQHYRPEDADILFLAGVDWRSLNVYPRIEDRIPVINLIQGLRHADPDQPQYQYLTRRAVRICVSPEVSNAIIATGLCNGPVHVIPNGIDLAALAPAHGARDVDIFIGALKQPRLAIEVAAMLEGAGMTVDCLSDRVPRHNFLARMARARIAVLLPYAEEGFFLPALEAMALGCVVICPDCGGNRSFCIDGVSAITPAFDAEAITDAVVTVSRSAKLADQLRQGGRSISGRHDILTERTTFHSLLSQIGS